MSNHSVQEKVGVACSFTFPHYIAGPHVIGGFQTSLESLMASVSMVTTCPKCQVSWSFNGLF